MRLISITISLTTLLLTLPLLKASASPPPMVVPPNWIKNLPYTFVFILSAHEKFMLVGALLAAPNRNF